MRGSDLTVEQLRSVLDYDSETGRFVWKLRQSNAVHEGDEAGTLKPNGRRYINVNGRPYLAHRLAWFYVKGEWPKGHVKQRDGDLADSRFANLYESTISDTNVARGVMKNNASGHVGVGFDKRRGKYKAWIKRNWKLLHLGWFDTLEEACEARRAAELDFPRNLSSEEVGRLSHHSKVRRRQRVAWLSVKERFGDTVAWLTIADFVADVGEMPGARYEVMPIDPALPVGRDNFKWQAPASVRYDMTTTEGRNARRRDYHRAKPEIQRAQDLRKNYNLEESERLEMERAQNGLCAVCGQPETIVRYGRVVRLSIDHDHTTDTIRALLCGRCNSLIGLSLENPGTLRAAAAYLERHADAPANVVPLRKGSA